MRYVLVFISILFLAGCASAVPPIADKYHVILAPESLYNCPKVTVFPKVETLTDLQAAKLLVKYAEYNNICKSSLNAIHAFYANAKAKFEQGPKKN